MFSSANDTMVGISDNSSESEVEMLLFGPQILTFDQETLDKLRRNIADDKSHKWILNVIAELPGQWANIIKALPFLGTFPGEELLDRLNGWLKTGNYEGTDFTLPNILLTPLVVATQLSQYVQYLKKDSLEESVASVHQEAREFSIESIGFCTGILSAFAVSSSANQQEFEQYGSVAVRLAMLIGAVVDAQDVLDTSYGKAESYATAWKTPEVGAEMVRIMDEFPEAYKSVLFDEMRATLTTSARTAPTLIRSLQAAGITAQKVGLRGRFHCQVHHENLRSVLAFCDASPAFQLPDIADARAPSHVHTKASSVRSGSMHHIALKAILEDQSDWYSTFKDLCPLLLSKKCSSIVSFGPDRCVPPSLLRSLEPRLVQIADVDQNISQFSASVFDPDARPKEFPRRSDNDVAVVGMSIKVAGADDLEEFWEIIAEGKSQHIEVPEDRFTFETQWRKQDPQRRWYGNFVRDVDAFDHKFFKRSPREAASQDPQQRLMLQAAYQAVEQSGYFTLPPLASKSAVTLVHALQTTNIMWPAILQMHSPQRET